MNTTILMKYLFSGQSYDDSTTHVEKLTYNDYLTIVKMDLLFLYLIYRTLWSILEPLGDKIKIIQDVIEDFTTPSTIGSMLYGTSKISHIWFELTMYTIDLHTW